MSNATCAKCNCGIMVYSKRLGAIVCKECNSSNLSYDEIYENENETEEKESENG